VKLHGENALIQQLLKLIPTSFWRLMLCCLVCAASCMPGARAQNSGTQDPTPTPPKTTQPRNQDDGYSEASVAPGAFLKNLGRDQKAIWTSPFRARIQDMKWLVPMIGLTAGLINADAELSSRVSPTGTLSKHSSTISNAGLAVAMGGAGSLYFLGKLHSDDHQRETGILSGEAAINSLIVVEALKLVTQRERPTDGAGQGRFWNSSSITSSSFPSAHAMITWSIASIVAHEYPGVATQVLSYGLATGVSLSRVYGRNHFPSDVVVGSAMGWMIGRQVYAAHHDRTLPGGGWGTFHQDTPENAPTDSRASAYVPVDSWVYPAFERLGALGVVTSGFQGMRPWTRAECARLLEEAQDGTADLEESEASRLYDALAKEFAVELKGTDENSAQIDSLYARVTGISGTPLTDGYHFGQTIVNDYGRPYQKGANWLTGFSSSGNAGPLGFYVSGEFDHAPSAPGLSQAAQNAIEVADQKPIAVPAFPIHAFNQFRLLDSYVTLNIRGWQASFGKQSLWLGPTQDSFLWSNNAEPIYMFRVSQTTPKQLGSIFKYLGPYRTEFWVGKMTGHHFVATQDVTLNTVFTLGRTLSRQPLVNGFKISFKPTPNFEFGVGRTGVFGGPDFPVTLGTIKLSLFSSTNAQGRGKDPGDRRSTADFSYKIPGLRKWLTLYDESFVEDEISPIGYPRRAAHNPGLYLSRFPGLPHLDLRVEAAYTNLPGLLQPTGGGFFYWNTRYLDGYTNQGNIMGNATVGRQGISYRAQSTYWFASDKTMQVGYRSNIADSQFVGGGNLRDVFFRSEWSFRGDMSLSSLLQYEWWNFPILSLGNRTTDFTASIQLTYHPHGKLKIGGSKN
jgi:capsule assembly protein Wzi/PAP2 superfamily protein